MYYIFIVIADNSLKGNREWYQNWNEIAVIWTVDRNRHEDAVLRRLVGNAQTISGQQAYHKRPFALVSSRQVVERERSLG